MRKRRKRKVDEEVFKFKQINDKSVISAKFLNRLTEREKKCSPLEIPS